VKRGEMEITEHDKRQSVVTGWVLVSGLALLFLLYGLFMFVLIGDKGPPEWDFGAIADTPGQSTYSTSPEPAGNKGEPVTQHVSGNPPLGQGKKEGVK
jgi:hypothetical protein